MRALGIFGVIAGAIWVLIAFNIDPSVSTGYGRVINIGLMNEKQNHLMMSMGLLVISVLLVLFGRKSASSVKLVTTSSDSDDRACPFCAEMIKRQAIKCKHCGSEVSPQEEEVAVVFFDKPDDKPIYCEVKWPAESRQ